MRRLHMSPMKRTRAFGAAALLSACAGVIAAPPEPAPKPAPAVQLHPTITEVLFAVPTGDNGDADLDGTRSATGDEFVELYNPHDRPINLKGYILSDGISQVQPPTQRGARRPHTQRTPDATTDRNSPRDHPTGPNQTRDQQREDSERDAKRDAREQAADDRIHFTFPDLELKPGECVVVFNGYRSTPRGPTGDEIRAAGPNPDFSRAYVLSMKCRTEYQAFSNLHDMVVLITPEGDALECVRWDFRDENATPGVKPPIRPDTRSKDTDRTTRRNDSTTRNSNRRPGQREIDTPHDKEPEREAERNFDAPRSTGSVQRRTLTGDFEPHDDIRRGELFSPGTFRPEAGPQSATPPEPRKPTPEKR
jgi:hypothetical protein